MIQVTIFEGQYLETKQGRTYHTIVGVGRNKRSYKKATAAAWQDFRKNDKDGTPILTWREISVNGKVVSTENI